MATVTSSSNNTPSSYLNGVRTVYVAKSCNFCERFRNAARRLAGTRLTTIIKNSKKPICSTDLFDSFANEKWLEIKHFIARTFLNSRLAESRKNSLHKEVIERLLFDIVEVADV